MLVKDIYAQQTSRAKILRSFFSPRQNPLTGTWEEQLQGLNVKIRISKKDEIYEIENPEQVTIKTFFNNRDTAELLFFVHLNDKIMYFDVSLSAFDAENISEGSIVEFSSEDNWDTPALLTVSFEKA